MKKLAVLLAATAFAATAQAGDGKGKTINAEDVKADAYITQAMLDKGYEFTVKHKSGLTARLVSMSASIEDIDTRHLDEDYQCQLNKESLEHLANEALNNRFANPVSLNTKLILEMKSVPIINETGTVGGIACEGPGRGCKVVFDMSG